MKNIFGGQGTGFNSLQATRDYSHAAQCLVRNCNNLVQSDNFEIAYKLSTKLEKQLISEAVERFSKDHIKSFITRKLLEGQPFEKLSIHKLRDIGRYLSIENYSKMNKLTLIEEVQNVATRLKENSERKRIQP